jgi:HPt (histidine-containing phosphotransfer) domain-containing protein
VQTVFDQPDHALAVEELPLIDCRVMNDWCEDLSKDDVAELLARVPGESHKCLSGIKEAVGKRDLAAAKRMAHRLKGMASNLGAARLARVARSIELASNDIAEVSARTVTLEATLIATLEALRPSS